MGTYDELIRLGNEFSQFLSNQEDNKSDENEVSILCNILMSTFCLVIILLSKLLK